MYEVALRWRCMWSFDGYTQAVQINKTPLSNCVIAPNGPIGTFNTSVTYLQFTAFEDIIYRRSINSEAVQNEDARLCAFLNFFL